jgi:hypothetical protein
VPRGRNADDRLAYLERRLEVLEAREASLPERRKHTNEEIVEIYLGLLCYICEGSTEKFAEFLVRNSGAPVEKAEEMARMIGRILEERRALAVHRRSSRKRSRRSMRSRRAGSCMSHAGTGSKRFMSCPSRRGYAWGKR